MSGGFIKINRQITDWRWWGNANAMAIWLYILVNANWSEGYWNHGEVPVRRGELVTSVVKMARELKLDRKTIRKYLVLFENDGQIVWDRDNRYTRIKVLNYALYQDSNGWGMDNSMDNPMDNSMVNSMDTIEE